MTIEVRSITSREEWLEWRSHDLTASDLGAVWGVDPYRTAFRVYSEKAGLIVPGPETNIMRRGRWLEHATMAALAEELPGYRLRQAGVYLRDTELRLGCTPDVLAEDPEEPDQLINIQLKAISRPRFEQDWPGDTVPLGYQLQTLAEGMLLDANLSLLAVLVIDTYSADLVLRDVPRHAAAEEGIRQLVRDFWQHMAAGVRPAPDWSRDGDTIAELFPHAVADKVIDLTGDNRMPDLLAEHAALSATRKAVDARLDAVGAEVKAKLGDAQQALLPGWKVTWKDEERKAYTVPASTRRVLRVFERKEATP